MRAYALAKVNSPAFLMRMREREKTERLVIEQFKEGLSSEPYYQARMNDEHFWLTFVRSRPHQTQLMGALLEERLTAQSEPPSTGSQTLQTNTEIEEAPSAFMSP